MERNPTTRRARWYCFLSTVLMLLVAGCNIPSWPSKPKVEPVLPLDIGMNDLVNYLNGSADSVDSWVSRECQIHVKIPNGLRTRLSATMACSEPRRFRLMASGAFAKADVGSNDQHCWWWMTPGDPVMIKVKHEDVDYVRSHPALQDKMSMPFDADWLMEVLGVTRIDGRQLSMHQDSEPGRVNLVSEYVTPEGSRYRRIMVVDLYAGAVVAHRLVDASNHTVARAKLSRHARTSGAMLPRVIEIEWPTMSMSMTLHIKDISVNTHLEPSLWQPPHDPSIHVIDLGQRLRMTPDRKLPRMEPDRLVGNEGEILRVSGEEEQWDDEPKRRWWWPFGR